MSRQVWWLTALLLAALVARLAVIPIGLERWERSQGNFYDEYGGIAENLVQGNGFAYGWYGPVRPTSIHVPGYPLMLAAIFRVTDSPRARALVTICMNVALSLVLLLLVLAFARATLGQLEARLAGIAVALYPTQIHYSVSGIPTILYTCMLLAVVAGAWWVASDPRPRRGLLWGALLASCALTYSFVVVIAPLLAGWVWWASSSGRRRQALQAVSLAAGVALLLCFPWTLRNHSVHGEFVFLRDQAGTNLWWGNSSFATGGVLDRQGNRLGTMPDSIASRLATMGELEGDRYLGGLARDEMRESPRRVARLWWRKLGMFWWFGPGAGDDVGGREGWLLVLKALKASLLLLAAIGLARLLRRGRGRLAVLFLLVALGLSALHTVFHAGRMRYFFPLEVFLLILAAHAVASFWRARSARRAGA